MNRELTIGRALGVALIAVAALVAGALASASGPAQAAGSNSITTPVTSGVGGFSLTLDSVGYPVIAYTDVSQDLSPVLTVVHCNDANCAGGNESVTSPDVSADTGYSPSIALDASGNPVVSYHALISGEAHVKLLHCNDANCAGGDESITTHGPGQGPSLAIDASGNPVVSYAGPSGAGGLRVLHCNDSNCSGGDDAVASPDEITAVNYPSLALDASGNPVVSYGGTIGGELRGLSVLHCGNPACTAGNTIGRPAVADSGFATPLVLDGSGNPVVSYASANQMRLLRCGNPACTAGNTITTPEPDGDVGSYAALALDASGRPVLGYVASFHSFDVRVLHCGNATCESGNTVAAPDPRYGVASGHIALTLDGSGNPVIGYSAGGNDLTLLHCGDPTCLASKNSPPPFTRLAADVDCSHAVTATDALLILQFNAHLIGSLMCDWVADVNPRCNFTEGCCPILIDSVDAMLILQHTAGLIDSLPIPLVIGPC